MKFGFNIENKLKGKLGRAGILKTPHGEIHTPAFIAVGTKATVKSLVPEDIKELGSEAVLANTYHLYLEPGDELIKKAGGIHKFMNWDGPIMTDSGGFQVFSLGSAFERKIGGKRTGKISRSASEPYPPRNYSDRVPEKNYSQILGNLGIISGDAGNNGEDGAKEAVRAGVPPAKIDDEGVTFKSLADGSVHRFTPEKSIDIQRNIGADIIFAFDECASPESSRGYQKEAMERTHRWASRSLAEHRKPLDSQSLARGKKSPQALFGIVQGGRFEDLRKESAREISKMDFDGFGIGGSFEKKDMDRAVAWVNGILPEEKPRHLLGIGEPLDLFGAVENGCDTFDCVAPTRQARNGSLYTKEGRININNAKFVSDFSPIGEGCGCYACKNYTRAYIAHLFRSGELLSNTLASIHNLYFITHLVKDIRQSILDENFLEFKDAFIQKYYEAKRP